MHRQAKEVNMYTQKMTNVSLGVKVHSEMEAYSF